MSDNGYVVVNGACEYGVHEIISGSRNTGRPMPNIITCNREEAALSARKILDLSMANHLTIFIIWMN